MAQPEARLQRRIQEVLKEQFGVEIFVFKVHGSVHMMAGLPDLIGCYRGKFFGLEVKMPGGKTSERQLFVHAMIHSAGGICEVVQSPTQAVEIIASMRR